MLGLYKDIINNLQYSMLKIHNYFYEDNTLGCGNLLIIKLFIEPFINSFEDDIE